MSPLAIELISIGSELLDGVVVNSNAAFISRRLKEWGFTVQRQTTIADQHEIILETFSESLACTSLVIATGGLGPTLDDLTRAAACELFDSPLVFDKELAEDLKKRYGEFNSLQDQASVPKKALILPNKSGTAPGLIFHNGHATLILLPGVPVEMQALMDLEVLPYLQKTFQPKPKVDSKTLNFVNIHEGQVDPLLREIQQTYPKMHLGIYPGQGVLKVYLEGDKIQSAVEALLEHFGEFHYESSDGKIETAIHEYFIQKGLTLSIAESCTGGALASRLTALSGASQYFLGSIVAYSNNLKQSLLNVPESLLHENGAVSKEVAEAMVEAIQSHTGSSFSIAVTGIAGPAGGSSEKPVGTVYIALKKAGTAPRIIHLHAKGSRSMIIEQAVNCALGELLKMCKGKI